MHRKCFCFGPAWWLANLNLLPQTKNSMRGRLDGASFRGFSGLSDLLSTLQTSGSFNGGLLESQIRSPLRILDDRADDTAEWHLGNQEVLFKVTS